MAPIVSWWDELRKFGPEWSLPSSHSSPTKVKGQKRTSDMFAKQVLKSFLLRSRNKTHRNLTHCPQWGHHNGHKGFGVATQSLQWSRNHIYSVLFKEGPLILLPEYGFRVQVHSWEGVRHPRLPNPMVGLPSLCLIS